MTKDEMRHAAEQAVQRLDIPLLREPKHWPEPPYERIFKCGVLPWRVSGGQREYYLFKPMGKMPEKGDPGFQIGKGTREIYDSNSGAWLDYTSPTQLTEYGRENLETVAVTALREGIEELGLQPDMIEAMAEWGQAAFSSATTGELKTMWLFALRMWPECTFSEPDAEHAATVAREWLAVENSSQANKIRPDHLQIIRQIDKVLAEQGVAE